MFNKTKIKNISKSLNLNEENTTTFIFKQAKFLGTDAKNVLNSLIILKQLQEKEIEQKAEELKKKSLYKTKNVLISKYMEEIVKLYQEGCGSQKISKHIKENHRTTISKSAIDSFLKINEVVRNG